MSILGIARMIYLSCSVLHCSPKLITVYWSRGGGHEAQTQCMHFLLRSYCGKHTLKPFIPQNSAVGPNQRLHGPVSSRPSYSLSLGTDSTFTSPCPCRNPRSRLRLRALALDFAFAGTCPCPSGLPLPLPGCAFTSICPFPWGLPLPQSLPLPAKKVLTAFCCQSASTSKG